MSAPSLLILARDPAVRGAAAEQFSAAGFAPVTAAEVGGAGKSQVDAVLLFGALGDRDTEAHLKAIRAAPQLATCPVVLVAPDASDARFARQFRTGIVELLTAPDPAALKATLESLPGRAGSLHGKGDRRELHALMSHLRRAQRSGALTINPLTKNEGKALFLNGELQSAQYFDSTGDKALVSMLALANAWSFTEVAGAGEGPSLVVDVEATIDVEAEVAIDTDGDGLDDESGISLELEPAPAGEVNSAPAAADGKTRLLLVDDDPELCRMFSIILDRRGFQVTTAGDGVDGYESAKSQPFDVIVADLSMPRLDGWGLLRQIRDDFQTRETPLAFLSCHEDYRESLKALNAGAQAYLSKSVKHDALAAQIRTLLAPREQVRASLSAASPGPFELEAVGVQWFLRELGARGFTGLLEGGDGWASYELFFEGGVPVHASAQAGAHTAEGERAFNAFVAARGPSAQLSAGDAAPKKTLSIPLEDLLRDATWTLNENERRAKEALLVKARTVEVNPELFALYGQVGPQQWLPIARLICEQRLTPGEVIAQADASPLEVEETIRDLVRRGVVTLS